MLLYSEQGFFVEYIFPKKAEGDHFAGCPSQTGYLYIVAWSLEKELSLPHLLEKKSGVGVNELSFPYYKSIEEATNLTNDEFYNMFTNLESTYCINTLESLWIQ
ncbi:MAG: hypothetical protein CVU39_28240 [Chloroflexi bacterium HGW-Chloroflexi-10]|nr:MAG: hypothetical protein CVU39_28240 [Chloroflexi bacterium HGW-Chloroflexi-10]